MSATSSNRRCVLGLDLGTSSCKASLIDEQGRATHSSTCAYPTHAPQSGWAEQDPQDWGAAAAQAVRQLMTASQATDCHVQAIGLTCAAHIGVLMDEHHQPLRRAILWNDLRSAPQAQRLHADAGQLILHQSGQVASCSWTLAHLAWVKEHEPAIHARIRRVLLSKDYLAWQLTGRQATDPAAAVSAQLYDATTGRWSPELAAMAGLSVEMLPAVIPATGIVGELLPEVARQMHLPARLPVVTGSLDSATELIAAGCVKPGQGMIRLATAGGLQVVTPALSRHARRITYPHLHEPNWYVQAGTSTCAAAVAWAKDKLAADWSWEQVIEAASAVPAGCQDLLFHPYLQGERSPYWNPKLKAGFTGLTLAHDTGHLLRAVFEGTAFSIRDAMGVLADLPAVQGPLAVVGGGSRNRLWVSILAQVLDRPVLPMPQSDSALGAGLLAWRGIGVNVSPASPAASSLQVVPDAQTASLYAGRFQAYQSIAQRMVLAIEGKKVPLPGQADD